MSAHAFPLNTSIHDQGSSWWHGGFPHDDIKRIIAIGDALPKLSAKVGDGTEADGTSPDTRACTIAWIEPKPDTQWLFEKLGGIVRQLNAEQFGFDLWGFENLQYTVYNGAARPEFYDWHIDTMSKGWHQQRKLSMVLQLDDPQDYEGGELWLHGKYEICVPKEKGRVEIFPSYTLHRVTPVTKGLRRSLVGWVVGPEFR
jgi:PKHD-type hydroxylase